MIADDGSNGSVLTMFVAFLLVGGIASTIRGLYVLRRLERQAERNTFAGTVVQGPWGSTGSNHPDRPWSLP